MNALFYKAKKGGWISKMIALVTWTDRDRRLPALSHYEHMFSNTEFYSASEQDGCTRFVDDTRIHPYSHNWVRIPLHLAVWDVKAIHHVCCAEEGRPYDTFGAVLWHIPWQDSKKDYCSEQGARHLEMVGYIPKSSRKWSPNRLAKVLYKIHLRFVDTGVLIDYRKGK